MCRLSPWWTLRSPTVCFWTWRHRKTSDIAQLKVLKVRKPTVQILIYIWRSEVQKSEGRRNQCQDLGGHGRWKVNLVFVFPFALFNPPNIGRCSPSRRRQSSLFSLLVQVLIFPKTPLQIYTDIILHQLSGYPRSSQASTRN